MVSAKSARDDRVTAGFRLIGEELRTQADAAKNGPLILIGKEALTMRYTLAMQHLNIDSQSHGAQATWAGLFALAATLNETP